MLLTSATLFTSCEDAEEKFVPLPSTLEGVYVVNEGAFTQGNGSISFISDDSAYFNDDLFQSVNNTPLGDIVQSMSIYRRKAYICVNNSQKVTVVDMSDFKKIASVNISGPRYFLGYNGNGYISDWSDNSVKVLDLNNNTVTKSIPCGSGPEQLIAANNRIFVCNGGGFGKDSTITVINATSNAVTDTINVGVNPGSIVLDANFKLWVLCSGTLGPDYLPNTSDDIGGKLLQIDPNTLAIMNVLDFAQGEHPIKLTVSPDGQKLYYLFGESAYTGTVMQMWITDNFLPSIPLINRSFYGLGVKPKNGDIYGGIPSFSTKSYVLHYKSDGTFIDSVQVGIGPNGFAFN